MVRPYLRFLAQLLVVIALLGPAAHLLAAPGKLRLPADVWLAVQQNMYAAFPFIGALGYIGAPLACIAFARSAQDRSEVRAAWAAALLVLAAFASWALVVAPVNARISAATVENLPAAWTGWRLRWEAGHALSTLFVGMGLLLLLRASCLRIRRPVPSISEPLAAPAMQRR